MANTLKIGATGLGNELLDPQQLRRIDVDVLPRSVFLKLARVLPAATELVNLPPLDADGIVPAWLTEAEAKSSSSTSFTSGSVQLQEIAAIITFSDRLTRSAFVDPVGHLRGRIVAKTADKIDADLWNGIPDTDDTGIEGLLQQSGFQTIVQGAGGVDIGKDMLLMIRQLALVNREPQNGRFAFAVHSSVLHALRNIETTDLLPKYASVQSSTPSIWGVPIEVTNQIPGQINTGEDYDSTIVLADWQHVWVFTMPGTLKQADQATVDGKSMFETDSQALRFERMVSAPVVRFANAVVTMGVGV